MADEEPRLRKAPRRYDDETVSFTPQRLPKIAGRRVPGWEPRGRGCDKWKLTRKVVAIDEVLSEEVALERYKNKFVTPYEAAHGTDRGILQTGWQVFNCQRGTVLELVDEGQKGDDGAPLVVARIVGGAVRSLDTSTLQSLGPEAAQIMTTDFAQKRRSGFARGCIAHVGARQDREKNGGSPYWGQFGQYAHRDGKEDAHEDLAAAAAFVADAMIEADAPFNAREHEVASNCLASRCWINLAGGPRPLTKIYPACVIGSRAGNPQHIDKRDLIGSLFTPLGDADLLFALSQYEAYVKVRRGDVLYLNTPRVVHGACVPPAGYRGKAAFQTHLVLGLYFSKVFTNDTKAEKRARKTPFPARLLEVAPPPSTRANGEASRPAGPS